MNYTNIFTALLITFLGFLPCAHARRSPVRPDIEGIHISVESTGCNHMLVKKTSDMLILLVSDILELPHVKNEMDISLNSILFVRMFATCEKDIIAIRVISWRNLEERPDYGVDEATLNMNMPIIILEEQNLNSVEVNEIFLRHALSASIGE